MTQELKSTTNEDIKVEIQHRLEGTERELHEMKEKVNECEHRISLYEDELKKEGVFTVFQSLTVNSHHTTD